jgi:hypothetical protein
MSSLLHQLENNEAVLLMYLAGELPPEDCAEVEQHLAADAGLRAELERLRQTNDALTVTLSAADGVGIRAADHEAARLAAAVRRVSRAMVQFQLEQRQRAETPAEELPVRKLRLPRWAYPFAAAAMILISFVAYWGFKQGGGVGPGNQVAHYHESVAPTSPELAATDAAPTPSPLFTLESDGQELALSSKAFDVTSMFDADAERSTDQDH